VTDPHPLSEHHAVSDAKRLVVSRLTHEALACCLGALEQPTPCEVQLDDARRVLGLASVVAGAAEDDPVLTRLLEVALSEPFGLGQAVDIFLLHELDADDPAFDPNMFDA